MKNRAVSASRRPPENIQRQQQQLLQQQQQRKQQPQYNSKQPVKSVEKPKISISDAIGLTTIRLSKIEQFLEKLQGDNNSNSISLDNINNSDSDVFEIINTRLNNIEQTINNNKINERLLKCETDLTDTKGLLIQLVLKHEKLSTDINLKLMDVLQKVNSHESYILEQQSKSYINEPLQPEISQPELLQTDVLEN